MGGLSIQSPNLGRDLGLQISQNRAGAPGRGAPVTSVGGPGVALGRRSVGPGGGAVWRRCAAILMGLAIGKWGEAVGEGTAVWNPGVWRGAGAEIGDEAVELAAPDVFAAGPGHAGAVGDASAGLRAKRLVAVIEAHGGAQVGVAKRQALVSRVGAGIAQLAFELIRVGGRAAASAGRGEVHRQVVGARVDVPAASHIGVGHHQVGAAVHGH